VAREKNDDEEEELEDFEGELAGEVIDEAAIN